MSEQATIYALKWLNADGTPAHGGSGAWPLPVQQPDGTWLPGKWRVATGPLVLCGPGALHGCTVAHSFDWFAPACWLMEMSPPVVDDGEKRGASLARLIRPLAWDERIARLFAADCAERVLPLFEALYPDDSRPREAIAVARQYTVGQATEVERAGKRAAADADTAAWAATRAADAAAWAAADAAAWAADAAAADTAAWAAADAATWAATRAADAAAAWAAAWAAADAATWAATRAADAAAAWAAAWAAADAATWAATRAADAAAGAAERAWQADRLAVVLGLTAEEVARMALPEEVTL